VTSNEVPECVTFKNSEDHHNHHSTQQKNSISLQVVHNMSDVCQEYADHIAKYCKKGVCNGKCSDALDSACALKKSCKGVDILIYYDPVDQEEDNSESSDDEEDNEDKKINKDEEEEDASDDDDDEDTDDDEGSSEDDDDDDTDTDEEIIPMPHCDRSTRTSTVKFCSLIGSYRQEKENKCDKANGFAVLAVTLSITFVASALCCCACRRYRRRASQRILLSPYAVQTDMKEPNRIVIASIVSSNDTLPQIVRSKHVVLDEEKQIEQDHALAVKLSQE